MSAIQRSIVKLLICVVGITVFFASHNITLAEDDNFYRKVNTYISQKMYSKAWKLLESRKYSKDGNIPLTRAVMIILYNIPNMKKCDAVLELERAQKLGSLFARGLLNYLYNGNWVAIAAEEGNSDALYELAVSYEKSNSVGNFVSANSKLLAAIDVYTLYKRAALQGHLLANISATGWEGTITKLGGKVPIVRKKFKPVLCGTRNHPRGGK